MILLDIAWKLDRRALPLLVMLLVTTGLSLWQARWGYFLGVAFAWTLPWQMQALRRSWAAWLFFVVGWWPIMEDWEHRLFLEEEVQEQRSMKRAELVALRLGGGGGGLVRGGGLRAGRGGRGDDRRAVDEFATTEDVHWQLSGASRARE